MESFEAKPKKWGNSLGITIPKSIVEKEHLDPKKKVTVFILPEDAMEGVRKLVGTLPWKKSTQQLMDELDDDNE